MPISVVVAFSFNNPRGRFNYTWQGFTFKNWMHPFNYPGLSSAIKISIEIALLSTHRRDDPRHADRARARPLPLPRQRLD